MPAIAGDPNPNLALTLGAPAERIADLPTMPRLERTPDGTGFTTTVDEVFASHSVQGKDGVTLLMANPKKAGTG